jgi:hypothetical protein
MKIQDKVTDPEELEIIKVRNLILIIFKLITLSKNKKRYQKK